MSTQAEALAVLNSGANVILTGQAGSGKSYTLNKFIEGKRRRQVAVTATTGIAAAALNGQTFHSWANLGLQKKIETWYKFSFNNTRLKQIRNTQTLVIDEVSMMHDWQLDMIDEGMRIVRENDRPFGGLQVVLCGDFFQLPPVSKDGAGRFIDKSKVFKEADFRVCYLEENHRSKDDRLSMILNNIRSGAVTDEDYEILKSREMKPDRQATRLYSTNADIDKENLHRLSMIRSDSHYYLMTTRGRNKAGIEKLKRSVLSPEVLEIRVGAPVMATKNTSKFHNGSTGVVIDIDGRGLPIVRFDNGRTAVIEPVEWELYKGNNFQGAVTQLPIRLAWAITIHKSQGMTLDSVYANLSYCFAPGMGYVALSRATSLDGLFIKGLSREALRMSQDAVELDKFLRWKDQDAAIV